MLDAFGLGVLAQSSLLLAGLLVCWIKVPAAMGIVVGSVVEGVPESAIFGIQIGTGVTISVGFLAAVFVSDIPQAITPSADL